MIKGETKERMTAKCYLPVGLCPEDSHRTTEPAGRWDPEFSLRLWFSSWPSKLHSPGHTPSHRLLQTQHANNKNCYMDTQVSKFPSSRRWSQFRVPGMFLEPGLGINPLAWLTSTSSCPPLSTMPTWTSPAEWKHTVSNNLTIWIIRIKLPPQLSSVILVIISSSSLFAVQWPISDSRGRCRALSLSSQVEHTALLFFTRNDLCMKDLYLIRKTSPMLSKYTSTAEYFAVRITVCM